MKEKIRQVLSKYGIFSKGSTSPIKTYEGEVASDKLPQDLLEEDLVELVSQEKAALLEEVLDRLQALRAYERTEDGKFIDTWEQIANLIMDVTQKTATLLKESEVK